ncbi:MAG: maleylpyruvate isomerase N-terminal domain-containing protein [Sciscionella sp.]
MSTDLLAEGAALEEILTGLSKADWAVQTHAPGWTVAHLAWTMTWLSSPPPTRRRS